MFILYINKQKWLRPRFRMDNYFESPLDIDVMSLKEYYLKLLSTLEEHYDEIYQYFNNKKEKNIEATSRLRYTVFL